MPTTNYTFDDESNYSFDSQYIEFAAGKAQFKLFDNPAQTYNQPFDSDTGFTYNALLAEFTGGLVQQKDQIPANATCGANYNADIDLEGWSGGSVTGTAIGGAAVSGGKLDLTHSDVRYVEYVAAGNFNGLVQTGCIRLKYTPEYSGAPGGDRTLYTVSQALGVGNNLILLRHTAAGQLQLLIYTSTAGNIVNVDLGAWSPTASVEYEMELNFNVNDLGGGLGATRLFVDGVQFGSTETGIGTRSSNIGLVRIGTNLGGTDSSDFSLDDLMIFDTVQHTEDYSAGYSVPDNKYAASTVILPAFAYGGIGAVQAFTAFAATVANDAQIICDDKYYNSGWVASDGSWSQSNTVAEVIANIATLPATDSLVIKVLFNNSNTLQMNCSDLTVTYTGQAYLNGDTVILPNTGIQTDEVTAASWVSSTNVRNAFGLTNNTDKQYYNTSSGEWEESDYSFAKANTEAQLTAAVLAELLSSTNTFKWAIILSGDGTTQEYIDTYSITYNQHGGIGTAPPECLVFGTVYDQSRNLLAGGKVKATLQNSGHYNDETGVAAVVAQATIDASGYFSLPCVPNSVLADTNVYFDWLPDKRAADIDYYIFEILNSVDELIYKMKVEVPDLQEKNLFSIA